MAGGVDDLSQGTVPRYRSTCLPKYLLGTYLPPASTSYAHIAAHLATGIAKVPSGWLGASSAEIGQDRDTIAVEGGKAALMGRSCALGRCMCMWF